MHMQVQLKKAHSRRGRMQQPLAACCRPQSQTHSRSTGRTRQDSSTAHGCPASKQPWTILSHSPNRSPGGGARSRAVRSSAALPQAKPL